MPEPPPAARPAPPPPLPPSPELLYEVDATFNAAYDAGLARTGTPDRPRRRARFYNLAQFLLQTEGVPGEVIECGCWKGLSAFLIAETLRAGSPGFRGDGLTVVDSFEGLSEPRPEDVVRGALPGRAAARSDQAFKGQGAYAADLEEVTAVLSDFPGIAFARGWIPAVLETLPERRYRFAHIDLDLYEPILTATRHVLARLEPGGAVMCDDYGSLYWPGAKAAFDEAGAEAGLRVLSLSSGQGVLIGR